MARYNNLRELGAAFESGELDGSLWSFRVDNDGSHLLRFESDGISVDESMRLEKEAWDHRDLGPEELAIAALEALGIPAERA